MERFTILAISPYDATLNVGDVASILVLLFGWKGDPGVSSALTMPALRPLWRPGSGGSMQTEILGAV
jgi:hypothetical protein